jgi:hypothetical protein
MMRHFLTLLVLTIALRSMAQSGLPVYHPAGMGLGYYPTHGLGWTDPKQKWALQPYASFSTGYMFSKAGGASYFSAPIGLQLTRKLNDNFYAFAGASIAPTYMNFNGASFMHGAMGMNPGMGYYNPNGLNLYQRAELGLMYVNDAKTFSISGSISVQRGGNPFIMPQPVTSNNKNITPISHR